MEKSGPSTYTLNISPVLKETVDDAFDEIVSSVTDDSDCYDAIQDEMHLGPFSGPIPLKNVGAIYIAKGLSIICEENRSSLVSKLNHVNLSNQKIGWRGLSIICDVLSNFDIQTFDFENNALFPNEAGNDAIHNVSKFLLRDKLVALSLSKNTLVTFDRSKKPSLAWLLTILFNLKELKILRLRNRLTKKFKIALGNLLLESPNTPGLYSSFLCNKFRVQQNEKCVTINPDRLVCNSDDIVLLAGILSNHSCVQSLDIRKQSINKIGATALASLISKNQNIRSLNLQSSLLGDYGLQTLSKCVLLPQSKVTYLNIVATKVTEVGLLNFAQSILEMKEQTSALAYLVTNSFCINTDTKSLSIRKTYRESDIMMILSLLSLNNNSTLKILNLRNMKVNIRREVQVRQHFCNMIKRNDFIKFLNIADTFLDTGSTALVLDAIGENYGLINIVISSRWRSSCSLGDWNNAIMKRRAQIPLVYEIKVLVMSILNRYSFERSFPAELVRYIFDLCKENRIICFAPCLPKYYSSGGP